MTAVITIFLTITAFLSALSVLTLASKVSWMENLFFRVLAGGTIGGISSKYLTGVTPTLSFTEAALNGDFGYGGYAFIITNGILIGVWSYNLAAYRGQVIV